MTIVEWRALAAPAMAPAYDAERVAWNVRFGWETSSNWREVEQARAAGRLPGFAAWHEGRVIGWCFYLRHEEHLQIGGITAVSPMLASDLLRRIGDAPEAATATGVMAFVPDLDGGRDGDNATSVIPAFAAAGFAVRRFAYLRCPLTPALGAPHSYPPFHVGRLPAVADLFARAYPGADPTRAFAPRGTIEEWRDYTSQLVAQTGCGAILPWASVLDEDAAHPGRLLGAVLATSIGPRMGHLAQVAIDTEHQGQGRGRRLLGAALSRLKQRGFTDASLLVAEDNRRALALYTSLGFEASGRFVSAWQNQPRRLSNAACSTGGVSTFR